MPGKLRRNNYDLVEEAYDSKSPEINEEAFEHGVTFKVKYIGTKDIHKPGSRAEIVSSMRRIRYEEKAYGSKKEKTELTVAVTGLRKKKPGYVDAEVMHYPINRIFYVSHDSQDLQIFSFISKEDDVFKCSVFKATSKWFSLSTVYEDDTFFFESQELDDHVKDGDGTMQTDGIDVSPNSKMDLLSEKLDNHPKPSIAPLTIQQLRHIFQQQLDYQRQETQALQAQVTHLTQELSNEKASRQVVQNQLDQVLKQNKELIMTVTQLVEQVQSLQNPMHGRGDSGVSLTLDMDGNKALSGTGTPHSHASSSVNTSPFKEGVLSMADLAKHRLLGEPTFPHIPPPTLTPSPVVSHQSELDALGDSVSSLQSSSTKIASSESFLHNGTLPEGSPGSPLLDFSSSDLEVTHSRHEPFPQQFLQFVFDNSDPSRANSASSVSPAQKNGVGTAKTSSLQRNMTTSAILNGSH
ncbi:Dystrophin-like protein 1 [Acropora cervicornis]|uniref:Dystrophin-like protein 1 n=1 Tax=Acropora cervicornis TaxID=6130 RepID=A0AAD9QUB8_ACRCE|nr:Dystrophin-like protein 1 [Acropora cervicornis]